MAQDENFTTSAAIAVQHLTRHTGIACCAVSRITAGRQVFLHKVITHPKLSLDPWVPFRESICTRMIEFDGPHVITDLLDEPAYARIPLAMKLPVAAYAGVPIVTRVIGERGPMFGSLCVFHPEPQPDLSRHLPEIEATAIHLSKLLERELEVVDTERRMAREMLAREAGSREVWYDALVTEEDTATRYGDAVSILMLEVLDGGIASTIDIAFSVTRPTDLVAKVSENAIGILAAECDLRGVQFLAQKITNSARERGLQIALGYATRNPLMSMDQTWLLADATLRPLSETPTSSRSPRASI